MIDGDLVALHPTLNSGGVFMAKQRGHPPDAPKTGNDLRMGFHLPYVRRERTTVNAENVLLCDDKYDMGKQTVGAQLIALRERSGLSLEQVAKLLGLKGRSSVQRLFTADLDTLGPVDALRLADAFEGTGTPPITREEVTSLSKFALAEVRPNDSPGLRNARLPRDVPVYGTAMGTYLQGGEEEAIEQAFINQGDVIEYLARPPGYANRTGLYSLYVSGTSMEPRWESGDPLYVDPKRPASIGDDVIVYLMKPSGEDNELEAALIKRLVRRTATHVELEQFNPPRTFRVELRRISAIHRVIPRRELLAF